MTCALRRGAAGLRRHLQHACAPRARSRGVSTRPPGDVAVGLEQRDRLQLAVGREDRVGARELHQVHRDAVAVRHRRLLDRLPRLRRPQPPRHLAGEAGLRRRAEARVGEHRPTSSPAGSAERDLRGADVGRLLDHLLDGERAFRMRVVDRVRCRSSACRARSGSRVSGRTLPGSSAAAMVNGFSVEPGSNTSVSARLRIRSRATLSRWFGL